MGVVPWFMNTQRAYTTCAMRGLLCLSLFCFSCEPDQKALRGIADDVMDVARQDPERPGKVGVYMGLIVRHHAMNVATRIETQGGAALTHQRAPVCVGRLPGQAQQIRQWVRAQLSSSPDIFFEQQITYASYSDGGEQLTLEDRYGDMHTVLKGDRWIDMRWRGGTRLLSSSRGDARYVEDPMPMYIWQALRDRHIRQLESLIMQVPAWQRVHDMEGGYRMVSQDTEGAVRLVCEDGGDQVTSWGGQGGILRQVTLLPSLRDGQDGWLLSATYVLGREELLVEIWQGEREEGGALDVFDVNRLVLEDGTQ